MKFRHYVSEPMSIGFGRREIFWRLYLKEGSSPERIVDAGSVKFWFDASGAFLKAKILVVEAENRYLRNAAVDEAVRRRAVVVDRWRQAYSVEVSEPFFSEVENGGAWVCDVMVFRPDGMQVMVADLLDRRGRALRDRLRGSSSENARRNALAYGRSHVVEYDLPAWMRRVDAHAQRCLPKARLLQA